MGNVLYIKDIEAKQGAELIMSLNLKNAEENITAFECKVYLPTGVEWAYTIDKRGNKVLTPPTFNENRTDANYHTINSIKQMDDGSYYIIVYSDNKEIILENDGAILYLPVVVSNELEAGVYNIMVMDIVIVNKNTEQTLIDKTVSKLTIPTYTLGDANDDDMINITDVVAVISYMLQENPSPFIFKAADVNEDDIINVTDIVGIIDIMTSCTSAIKPRMAMMKSRKTAKTGNSLEIVPFTVAEGTTAKTIAIELNNPGDEFTAFECKVYLPEGIEWAYTIDKRGNKIFTQPTFNEDRTDTNYHTINSIQKMDDGGYYVIVYSDKKEIFLEEEGAILNLPLTFDENLAAGVYDIRIGGIVLARPDVTQQLLNDYTVSVMIGSPDIAAITLNGDFTSEAIDEYNDALRTNTYVASLDLTNAVSIDGETTFVTGNKNLLVYVSKGKSIANTANAVVGDVCESLVLTDGYPFCAPKAFTATEALYKRTFGGNCATVCLPFAPTAGNIKFYELSSVNKNVLNFTSTGSPMANTPYIIKADGTEGTANASNVGINTTAAGTATTADWTFNGTYDTKTFTSDDGVYALSAGKLYHNTGTLTISPFRAYFTFSGNEVKEMNINIDGEMTGINSANKGDNGNESQFNLNGQAVGSNYRGIVIINGRKEFRK
ncbi:MAG: dockerin type I repeat-containing protein [Bacteroidaceae bacterium]|nr:dockerin type I repeat-containing protein [Bacteroidaceae bacterium]